MLSFKRIKKTRGDFSIYCFKEMAIAHSKNNNNDFMAVAADRVNRYKEAAKVGTGLTVQS